MNLKTFERSPEQEKIEKRRLVCIRLISEEELFFFKSPNEVNGKI